MTILHVDLNSYFATMEQQQNPWLRRKPVGIVKDIGRTCIIAASREAKAWGVKTGDNVYDSLKRCPRLILIKADFDKYLFFTKRFHALIASFTPKTTIFSLDEAFLDIADCLTLYGSPERLAVKIQKNITKRMGEWVTASIGIAENCLLAKLAGEYAPKGGYFRITNENRDEILGHCRLTDICGIGPRLAEKLEEHGVTNLLQLRQITEEEVKRQFGPFWGAELKRISAGEDSHLLTLLNSGDTHMHGVGRTVTGFTLTDCEAQIRRVLRNLVEEVCYKLRQMGMAGRQIAVFLEGEDDAWRAHRTLPYYVRHPDEIWALLYDGLYRHWQRTFPIIRFGVHLGLLQPLNHTSLCWLPQWDRREKLWNAVDKVNEKYGLYTVRSATLLSEKPIKPEVTGYFGDKAFWLREKKQKAMLYS